jgi:hypothetical protein
MAINVTVTPQVQEVEISATVQPYEVQVSVIDSPILQLTTDGTSGDATFNSFTGVLNIPNYSTDLSGVVPTSRTLTINGTAFDLSANRSWTVGDLLSSGSYANPSWITSLGWNKISSTPTTLAGYGITDAQPTLSLTTTGSSGASTLVGSTLNIPEYTLSGLGGIGGTLATGQVAFGSGTNTIGGDNGLTWDNTNKNLDLNILNNNSIISFRKDDVYTNYISNQNGALLIGRAIDGVFTGHIVSSSTVNNNDQSLIFGARTSFGFAINKVSIVNISSNGIRINQSTDAGFRLDVNGTARVQGALTVTGSTTASGAIARGANYTPTLIASANNDVLVGLDINPTFTNGAFTGVSNLALRVTGTSLLTNGLYQGLTTVSDSASPSHSTAISSLIWSIPTADSYVAAFVNTHSNFGNGVLIRGAGDKSSTRRLLRIENNDGTVILDVRGQGETSFGALSPTRINNTSIVLSGASTIAHVSGVGLRFSPFGIANAVQITQTTGNVLIGTTTDAGFRLDVNGTARVQGELTVNGVQIGLGGGSISSNTRVGLNALNANTTGIQNTAFGRDALLNNTTPNNNSAFGHNTLRSNTTGFQNTAIGASALSVNNGNNNTASGVQALQNNTTGATNTANGFNALNSNTTGISNTASGAESLSKNTTGSNNVGIGLNAGRFIANGSNLTLANNSNFIGFDTRANADNETNQIVIGHTAIGLGSNTTVIGNSSTTFGRWWGNLLIGTSTNVASSALTVDSTTKGFLPPRMTGAQAELIATPAEGLMVYATDGSGTTITSKGWWGYSGATWEKLN